MIRDNDSAETKTPDARVLEDLDSEPWLRSIEKAEEYFREYQENCDKVDKRLGKLEDLAKASGDRQLQVFHANLEVLKPTVYSRPPQPVVVPAFKTQNPVPRRASEILERALITDFRVTKVHDELLACRDDMLAISRGVPWVRVETDEFSRPKLICEHVFRRDFLHSPARCWREVEWVAKKSYLTRKKMRQRFQDSSDGAWADAKFLERDLKKFDEADEKFSAEKKAEVWEIWHKVENVVVWVTPGVDRVLDAQPPLFNLEDFFPCPEPAYSAVERDTLKPVPELAFYIDQLDEINDLTARIAALSDALRVKGFYPGGTPEIGEAVEKAWASTDDSAILVPVADMGRLSTGSGGKLVEWFPVQEVAVVIRELVELRRQLMDDVYQVTGLSDIMRGATEASETATAQNLKAEYGSVRVRNRQEEMVRLSLDVTKIKAELMAELFDARTLLEMSQVEDLPQRAEIERQKEQLQAQAMQAAQQAQMQGVPPERMQQAAQQVQAQLQELENTVTIDAVMELLQSQRLRPFLLRIETDSTIQPNEDAEKARRIEFLEAIGGFAERAMPLVMQMPQSGGMVAEMLKFAAGGFRAGRDLEAVIDDFGDQLMALQQQPQGPSPEQMEAEAKARAEQERNQLERDKFVAGDANEKERIKIERARANAEIARGRAEAGRGEDPIEAEKREHDRARMRLEREQFELDLEDRREQRQFSGRERQAKLDEVLVKSGFKPGTTAESAEEEMKAIMEMMARRDEQAAQMLQALIEGQAKLAEGQQALAQALSAPKEFTFDAKGKPNGVAIKQMNGAAT